MKNEIIEILKKDLEQAEDNLYRAKITNSDEDVKEFSAWYEKTKKCIEWVNKK